MRLPAWINQACGRRVAREAEGAVQRTAALRLSSAAPAARSRGLEGELEEALPDLPRRGAERAQARRAKTRHWDACAHGDPARAEPEMVAGLHLGQLVPFRDIAAQCPAGQGMAAVSGCYASLTTSAGNVWPRSWTPHSPASGLPVNSIISPERVAIPAWWSAIMGPN